MYFKKIVLLLLVIILSGCAAPLFTMLPADTSGEERDLYVSTQIDKLLDSQLNDSFLEFSGLSVLVLKDNEVIYQRSEGIADIEKNQSITSNTIFNLASISKPITAIAIMQLVDGKKISLDDSILHWLPQLPASWGDIKIHHLLTHQSGVPFCFYSFNRNTISQFHRMDNQELIKNYITDEPLFFSPGSSARYCNIDYIFLAEIIKEASGMTYEEYLQKYIFTPLNMDSTYVYLPNLTSYVPLALNFGSSSQTFGMTFSVTGALNVFSSVDDLKKLVTGLLAGSLISEKTLQDMISDKLKVKKDSSNTYFGYGWLIFRSGQVDNSFYHYGDMDGYFSFLDISERKKYIVISLSNGGNATKKIIDDVSLIVQAAYENSDDL